MSHNEQRKDRIVLSQPRIGPRELQYQNPYQRIYLVKADFGRFTKEYFVMDTGERAGMVAVRDQSVLLVRQYRLLINDLSWEIPGGKVDEGETPEMAAVRECYEESGVRCFDPQPLLFFHKGMDTTLNPTYIFLSKGLALAPEPRDPSSSEVTSCEWVPLRRCLEMIFDRQIVDALTIAGILAYQCQTQNGMVGPK